MGWEYCYCLNLVDTPSQFEVPWGWELFGGSVAAELLNPASVVAQAELHNPGSCAICQKQLRKQSCAILRVAQFYELRKQSCVILEVAQAELRNPGSCAGQVSQS